MSGPTLRKRVPEPLRRRGRDAALGWGRATAWLRAEPTFLMIGGQRCGTTSLFRALMSHPQVFRPVLHKGVNYFDLNHARGWTWYRGHFPVAALANHRSGPSRSAAVFEASGYYLYNPFAVERIAESLPEVKLVVMLRDPVERAYSAYQHELARGFEWETFETALDLEDDRLVGEIDRMRRDPGYESFSHRHHSYQHRGHYAEQLERVFEHVPAERVHVMTSEDFFERPASEFAALSDFLGLDRCDAVRFDRYNAQPRSPMTEPLRERLASYFAAHDGRLAQLLGRPPSWGQPVGSPETGGQSGFH